MLSIRPTTPADVPTILHFIHELAHFEREPHSVLATEADILRDGFTEPRRFICLLAEIDGVAAGFALYFTSYSTWLGHHGIRLEDLYVLPEFRSKGVGKALLAHLARIAVDEGCPRLEWDVRHWNESAIAVYHSIGATMKNEWHIMRLTGDPLHALAAKA
jgi:GNAT superfamily N-acetyltransferase